MCVYVYVCVCVCVYNYGTYLVYHCAGAKRGALSSSVATRSELTYFSGHTSFKSFFCVGNTNRATSSTDKVDEGCDGEFVICCVPT